MDDDTPTPSVSELSLRKQTTLQALELSELAEAAAKRFDAACSVAMKEGRQREAIEAAEDASSARALADEFKRWKEIRPTEPVRQGLVMRLTKLGSKSLRQ